MNKALRKEIKKHKELYIFMIPALIILIIFSYGPMYGIIMAFQDVKIGTPILKNEWIGLDNFARFFSGAWAGVVIKNTITICVLSALFCWPMPLILALLLHNSTNKFIAKTAQNFSYLPHLLSIVVTIGILRLFCDGETGLINILLVNLGQSRINFFGDPDWVYPLYIISGMWTSTGYSAIVYLSSLSAVDNDIMEAAEIDGASKLKRILLIQLPCIMPTVVTMLILNMGRLFAMGADKMLLMQTSLNISSSEIISTYVYKQGIENYQYGFSTAVGLFQNIVSLILVLSTNKISKKLSDVSIF
ncbi:MAG: sugar ABC transporter permease [Lachnospiraceae bacterium]|nr:sugar ABC transporter permease [Lachnospiraceae bacterium]MBP3594382.1 sugar ABC transporter permease [Lachnospiraceae bacterium]